MVYIIMYMKKYAIHLPKFCIETVKGEGTPAPRLHLMPFQYISRLDRYKRRILILV
jgi:hypothetical protein